MKTQNKKGLICLSIVYMAALLFEIINFICNGININKTNLQWYGFAVLIMSTILSYCFIRFWRSKAVKLLHLCAIIADLIIAIFAMSNEIAAIIFLAISGVNVLTLTFLFRVLPDDIEIIPHDSYKKWAKEKPRSSLLLNLVVLAFSCAALLHIIFCYIENSIYYMPLFSCIMIAVYFIKQRITKKSYARTAIDYLSELLFIALNYCYICSFSAINLRFDVSFGAVLFVIALFFDVYIIYDRPHLLDLAKKEWLNG